MSKKLRFEVFYTNNGTAYRGVEEVSRERTMEETVLSAWREVFRKEGAKVDMIFLYADPINFDPRIEFQSGA